MSNETPKNGAPADEMVSVVQVLARPNTMHFRVASVVGPQEMLLFLMRAVEKVRKDVLVNEISEELQKRADESRIVTASKAPPWQG